MNDFIFQNTTKVYFGKNQLQYLHEEVKKYGDKAEFLKELSLYIRNRNR